MSDSYQENITSSEEVIRALKEDLKVQNLTKIKIAERTGYSRQTIAKILSSNQYLNAKQAKAFASAFGYNPDFLMHGEYDLNTQPTSVTDLMDAHPPKGEHYSKQEIEKLAEFTRICNSPDETLRFVLDTLKKIARILSDRTFSKIVQYLTDLSYPEESKLFKLRDEDGTPYCFPETIQEIAYFSIQPLLKNLEEKHKSDDNRRKSSEAK